MKSCLGVCETQFAGTYPFPKGSDWSLTLLLDMLVCLHYHTSSLAHILALGEQPQILSSHVGYDPRLRLKVQ